MDYTVQKEDSICESIIHKGGWNPPFFVYYTKKFINNVYIMQNQTILMNWRHVHMKDIKKMKEKFAEMEKAWEEAKKEKELIKQKKKLKVEKKDS